MKFLKKFTEKKNKPLPITDQMKQKLAEQELSNKINKLADWLEAQKDWNLFDGYVVMGFIMKQSLAPQLGDKLYLADKAIESLFIQEVIEKASDIEIKHRIIDTEEIKTKDKGEDKE